MRGLGSHVVAMLAGAALVWGSGFSSPDEGADAGVAPTVRESTDRPESRRLRAGSTDMGDASSESDENECLCGHQRAMYESLCEDALVQAYGRPLEWPADAWGSTLKPMFRRR